MLSHSHTSLLSTLTNPVENLRCAYAFAVKGFQLSKELPKTQKLFGCR
jgi:hypothetical protein